MKTMKDFDGSDTADLSVPFDLTGEDRQCRTAGDCMLGLHRGDYSQTVALSIGGAEFEIGTDATMANLYDVAERARRGLLALRGAQPAAQPAAVEARPAETAAADTASASGPVLLRRRGRIACVDLQNRGYSTDEENSEEELRRLGAHLGEEVETTVALVAKGEGEGHAG
jgi:hypothetical protein